MADHQTVRSFRFYCLHKKKGQSDNPSPTPATLCQAHSPQTRKNMNNSPCCCHRIQCLHKYTGQSGSMGGVCMLLPLSSPPKYPSPHSKHPICQQEGCGSHSIQARLLCLAAFRTPAPAVLHVLHNVRALEGAGASSTHGCSTHGCLLRFQSKL